MPSSTLHIIEDNKMTYTPKEGALEAISLFASQICNTPMSFISIINKNKDWFKAGIGINELEEKFIKDFNYINTSGDKPKITEIENIANDEVLFNHPLILKKNIVYYASVPLISPSGQILGSIGVMDRKKRKLTQKQRKAFLELSNQVIETTAERLSKNEYEKNIVVFQKKNEAIEDFTNVALENMTSPLNTISLLSDIIYKNCSEELSLRLTNYLDLIEASSKKMIKMINEVKDFYDHVDLIALPKEEFLLGEFLDQLNTYGLELTYKKEDGDKKIFANRLALKKLIESQNLNRRELVDMSVENHKINISVKEDKEYYFFYFKAKRLVNKKTLTPFNTEEEHSFSSISQTLIASLGGSKTVTLNEFDKVVTFSIKK